MDGKSLAAADLVSFAEGPDRLQSGQTGEVEGIFVRESYNDGCGRLPVHPAVVVSLLSLDLAQRVTLISR
jgi:hypothetical protein